MIRFECFVVADVQDVIEGSMELKLQAQKDNRYSDQH